MKMFAHIARLAVGVGLLAMSPALLAKNGFDLIGSGTGKDLSVDAAGTITSELKGQSTLLGNFTGVVVHSFKNSSGEFEGSGFLRAMSGDVLRFDHKGKLHKDDGPMELKGSFDVTGGTGAFEGASGKVKFEGQNFGHGIVEYTLDGEVSFEDDDDGHDRDQAD
jgi:hypothetical protein